MAFLLQRKNTENINFFFLSFDRPTRKNQGYKLLIQKVLYLTTSIFHIYISPLLNIKTISIAHSPHHLLSQLTAGISHIADIPMLNYNKLLLMKMNIPITHVRTHFSLATPIREFIPLRMSVHPGHRW